MTTSLWACGPYAFLAKGSADLCENDCPTGQLSRKKFLSIYQTLFPGGTAAAFYEHVFRTFDEDGSGRIDFKEFLQKDGCRLCGQQKVGADYVVNRRVGVDYVVNRRVDVDYVVNRRVGVDYVVNRRVDVDYVVNRRAISITQSGKPEEKLELAFRLYDIDRNGSIDEQEMSEIIKAIYLMTEQDMEKVGDAPFRRTQDIFTKMDINNDGVLSKDEFIKGCMNDETLYRLLACSSAGGDANTNAAS
ncbi:hypothetical protein NP493_678g00022 [Ridgeia piscesae]|uniref:EF-hand domain-containing protein n=1 Tax=Ridgeia piscesae TaxID=27915 RepID=A0AAD9KRF8_RIDPI|nr:hypothetical protein NP493_678g00022 [Ridgeia piscesae]